MIGVTAPVWVVRGCKYSESGCMTGFTPAHGGPGYSPLLLCIDPGYVTGGPVALFTFSRLVEGPRTGWSFFDHFFAMETPRGVRPAVGSTLSELRTV